MAGSIRKFFESLAYAGLKPIPHGGQSQRGRLRTHWDRLVTGGPSPSDPLYLSNRNWKQKLRLWLVVSSPLAVMIGTAAYIMLAPPPANQKQPTQMTSTEIAAQTAIIPQGFTVAQTTDLQVTEVTVENTGGGAFVVGILKNNTGRSFGGADLTFDLTDEKGSQVGAAGARAEAIGPNGTVRFRVPIAQRNATFVLVREVHSL